MNVKALGLVVGDSLQPPDVLSLDVIPFMLEKRTVQTVHIVVDCPPSGELYPPAALMSSHRLHSYQPHSKYRKNTCQTYECPGPVDYFLYSLTVLVKVGEITQTAIQSCSLFLFKSGSVSPWPRPPYMVSHSQILMVSTVM
jgi:hypothetical protein